MKTIALALLLIATSAAAQQQPDAVTLQKAIAVLQAQRNQAMDALASAEVQRAVLAEEVEKLKTEMADLKKKVPAN